VNFGFHAAHISTHINIFMLLASASLCIFGSFFVFKDIWLFASAGREVSFSIYIKTSSRTHRRRSRLSGGLRRRVEGPKCATHVGLVPSPSRQSSTEAD
jgi:hypothetical protein